MSQGIADYQTKVERQEQGLFGILWSELKPYPGRDLAALRLAITCTAIVLISNTFRLPLQDVLPFLVLFTSKEETITTTITAVLALIAITISVGAALFVFKCTGNRPEFRIPGMAVEIFVGMYLFRVLAVGPVGFILAFIVSVSQSIVDLFPTPEDAVHEFLWVWVAVALGAGLGWLSNLLLFPVPARRVLQREFVDGWQQVANALTELIDGSPGVARRFLRPLVKRGPVRLLKLLKLSLLEAPDLRPKQAELTRLVLALDKTSRLIFSYSDWRSRSAQESISSSDKAILSRLKERAEYFGREFVDGFVPSPAISGSLQGEIEDSLSPKVIEAERTVEDLASKFEESHETKPAPRGKKSLFVADAFTNPKHVQFALKVTLAGMIGYIFYTASDYFGIHTVYYTPLIIALGSTGATMHKGVLRIVGGVVGGGLGLICTIWLIPRFETLGMYLLIVFCLHGLAAWVAFGSERISYMGLQIALTFDLGVLKDYGPPKEIDPIRDRFIGIILGIIIISIVFALVWPEDARSFVRQKLAAGLRSIGRLLSLGGSSDANVQRQQLELEIASRLSEANTFEEQSSFEALLYGREETKAADLKKIISATEEVYAASLPWVREQAGIVSAGRQGPANRAQEIVTPLMDALEASTATIEGSSRQDAQTVDESLSERDVVSEAAQRLQSFEQLAAAVRELSSVSKAMRAA
ncbi:MAG: FUSC family protein [Verrucomicrobia bacterium]|nr:FUSC family protein [Verrucomicrobiota bacterium]